MFRRWRLSSWLRLRSRQWCGFTGNGQNVVCFQLVHVCHRLLLQRGFGGCNGGLHLGRQGERRLLVEAREGMGRADLAQGWHREPEARALSCRRWTWCLGIRVEGSRN